MKRTTFLAAALATTLAWATPSAADTIQFDIDGGGPSAPFNAIQFDWFAGNTYLQLTGATTGHILFQANLNTVQNDQGGSVAASGPGSFLTIVTSFDVALAFTNGGNDIGITVVPNTGTARIWADNERGNNLSGEGFAGGTDANAVNILTATITSGTGTFAFSPIAPFADLDSFTSAIGGPVPEAGGNNYPGTLTRQGEGGAQFTGTVTQLNNAYFLNLAVGSSVVFTNSSQIDPFRQANPSNAFSSNTINNADVTGVITGGAICGIGQTPPNCVNGTGTNFVAQSDANSTFTIAPSAIPEPATLTLLGLGLLGAAVARRRSCK